MNDNICIITARGGSKRIPRKNIKEFCGKPIIAYSIEAAIRSGVFKEVMVSTDDEEIAEIAKRYGANVPFFRSAATATDYATTADVLLEVLDAYKKLGREFEFMCCLYPTAPFINANRLKTALEIMAEKKPVEIIPVVSYSFPPQRCFVIDESNYMRYKYKEYMNTRSQDLEKLYHDAGQFYVYDIQKYLKVKGQVSEKIMPLLLDEIEVQDIDDEQDWIIAEMKYDLLKKRGRI